jgi:hypothetical protein
MYFRKKPSLYLPKSIDFDDTNKLLFDIQRLLVKESRKEKIIKIFKSDK